MSRQWRVFKWRRDGRKSIRRGLYDKLTAFKIRNRLRQRGHRTARVESVPVEYPTKTHYSENFTRAELDCKCGCETPRVIQSNLMRMCRVMLEPLRERLGMPIPPRLVMLTVPVVPSWKAPAS